MSEPVPRLCVYNGSITPCKLRANCQSVIRPLHLWTSLFVLSIGFV